MATLKFENINKVYPNNVQAVFDFNLEIKDKEFIVFVGPSGCGKSTTLRMVAGLEEITKGNLYIDGKLVNTVMPKDRDIAMVFQNYALYPHMTIFNNIAFGLKIRKYPFPVLDKEGNTIKIIDNKKIAFLNQNIKEWKRQDEENENKLYTVEIEKALKEIEYLKANPTAEKVVYKRLPKNEIATKVENAAEILGLKQYLKRKPGALSGGQKQRVALGRAIVRDPKVFLMDEPLSNLDAKLRVQTRKEIIKIHKRVGATTIYVTHDQTEAMTMADRIVIMKDGYIQQIGTPEQVYADPDNIFVGGFIGSPAMNFYNGKILKGKFYFDGDQKNCIELNNKQIKTLKEYEGKELVLGVRPEHTYLLGDYNNKHPTNKFNAEIDLIELLGNEIIVSGYVNGQNIFAKMSSDNKLKEGDKKEFCFDLEKMYFFDKDSEKRIR